MQQQSYESFIVKLRGYTVLFHDHEDLTTKELRGLAGLYLDAFGGSLYTQNDQRFYHAGIHSFHDCRVPYVGNLDARPTGANALQELCSRLNYCRMLRSPGAYAYFRRNGHFPRYADIVGFTQSERILSEEEQQAAGIIQFGRGYTFDAEPPFWRVNLQTPDSIRITRDARTHQKRVDHLVYQPFAAIIRPEGMQNEEGI